MNWVEVQDKWEQYKPVLKTHWPELTEEELNAISGRREHLVQSLRERYGIGEAEAERLIAEFEKDVRLPGAVK